MDVYSALTLLMYAFFYLLMILLFGLWLFFVVCNCLRSYSLPPNRRPQLPLPNAEDEHAPAGLDPDVIESYTKFTFQEGAEKVKMSDCAVCLAGFERNETLLLIPVCGHVFHADCVDAWLRNRATCPCCRAVLQHPSGELTSSAV